jgi:ParB family transcriptional regulator, chromosome partitioning protein
MSKSELKSSTSITALPFDQLRIDEKANVRQFGRGVTPAFRASIKSLGIQSPLIVRPNGKGFVIVDGGKRFSAVAELVKAGELMPDVMLPVSVINATDAEARERSLTANIIREDMHPVDEYRAFAQLHADKEKPLDVQAIADHFGIDIKIVAQRLAFGALDDVILEAWLKNEIDEKTARAFTLCGSKTIQRTIFAKLTKKGDVEAYEVKRELKVSNVGRLLDLIGDEAYEKRGGKITRDLFGSDHIVSDEALLKAMADEKVAAICKELVEKEGWQWATSEIPNSSWQYGHLQGQFKPTPAEAKTLKQLEAACDDDNLSFEENEKANEGHDALRAEILNRSITAKQKAKAGCFVTIGDEGALQIDYGRTMPPKVEMQTDLHTGKMTPKKTKTKSPGTLTNALRYRLQEQRLTAIKAALVAHPYGNEFGLSLARIVASQIDPGSRYHAAPSQIAKSFGAIADSIAPKVMNAALRKAFDATGYFTGAPKSLVLSAITEATNADESRKLGGKKKSEIAKMAIANVPKTGWLPKELRTANYDGPSQKAAKKTTKSKSKKR